MALKAGANDKGARRYPAPRGRDSGGTRMNTEVQELVRETIELLGAEAPDLLNDDSPALAKQPSGGEFYLIGLIGGKDVGKSSFVNALVEQKISEPTSHGAGTEIVVAYAHRE